MLTVEDVKKRLSDIGATKSDEGAHVLEDRLYEDVLRAIADGQCSDPAGCAREALKSNDFDFSRWYA